MGAAPSKSKRELLNEAVRRTEKSIRQIDKNMVKTRGEIYKLEKHIKSATVKKNVILPEKLMTSREKRKAAEQAYIRMLRNRNELEKKESFRNIELALMNKPKPVNARKLYNNGMKNVGNLRSHYRYKGRSRR